MECRTLIACLFMLMCEFRCLFSSETGEYFTNTYAVHIEGGPAEAVRVTRELGFTYLGEIFKDHYHVVDHHHTEKRSLEYSSHRHKHLTDEPKVLWFEQQVAKSRSKRDNLETSLRFNPHLNDPKWPIWYLNRGAGLDMNVLPAWQQGYTGKGVVVSILDDGIERDHPDLVQNYVPEASHDVNGNDDDPEPRYNFSNENRHGTRCAGEVAAQANNSICSIGVAYNAGIGGVRMLDGDVTDAVEARSLSHNPQVIDVYSASWGPDDDGETVDGPGKLAKKAFLDGTTQGRNGLGSIFIWASGNGGRSQDSCGCDGYTNSIFTISVSSVSEKGNVPWYSETCASTLATTYSSGGSGEKQVVTTDLRKLCTDSHSGTSASAPLAAGICALALEANPNITWRDMQHVIVMTARPGNLKTGDWKENGIGHKVSHDYGFGLMDAGAMVTLARNWTTVPDQRVCAMEGLGDGRKTINGNSKLVTRIQTTGCQETPEKHVRFLEHTVSRITLDFPQRGELTITLISPSNTRSVLLPLRRNDHSKKGFKSWGFLTTHTWGENPQGEWLLEIEHHGSVVHSGLLHEWTLLFYGTQPHPIKSHVGPFHCTAGEYLISEATNDTIIHECQACHNACKTCFGPDNGNCVDCAEHLEKSDSYCLVPTGGLHNGGSVFHTTSGLVLGGYIAVLCCSCLLLFLFVFGLLQFVDHGYFSWCSGQDTSSSDSEDYEYRKLQRLHDDMDDEEETLLEVSTSKNGNAQTL